VGLVSLGLKGDVGLDGCYAAAGSDGIIGTMGKRKLVIFGTEVIARMANFYFSSEPEYEVCAFTVDRRFLRQDSFCNLPVIPFEDLAGRFPPSECCMFIAIGYTKMNKLREAKYRAAKELGYELASFVSPRCFFLTEFPVGDNCLIMAGTTIEPFVRIGDDVIIWSGCLVSHDVVIEDHCFLAPHVVVSGSTRVGRNSFLGANATLRDAITIAPETLVGAGAIIMKDTVEKSVYLPPRAVLFDRKSYEITIS
jgi:sugar O-acyltransferase (sialic acid O-acetyltransferase NeuD family)